MRRSDRPRGRGARKGRWGCGGAVSPGRLRDVRGEGPAVRGSGGGPDGGAPGASRGGTGTRGWCVSWVRDDSRRAGRRAGGPRGACGPGPAGCVRAGARGVRRAGERRVRRYAERLRGGALRWPCREREGGGPRRGRVEAAVREGGCAGRAPQDHPLPCLRGRPVTGPPDAPGRPGGHDRLADLTSTLTYDKEGEAWDYTAKRTYQLVGIFPLVGDSREAGAGSVRAGSRAPRYRRPVGAAPGAVRVVPGARALSAGSAGAGPARGGGG